MTAPVLSLIMPVHNEGGTLREVLERLGAVDMPVPYELIVVDDGSTDGAVDGIDRTWIPNAVDVRVVTARTNRGKGSALRKGHERIAGLAVQRGTRPAPRRCAHRGVALDRSARADPVPGQLEDAQAGGDSRPIRGRPWRAAIGNRAGRFGHHEAR